MGGGGGAGLALKIEEEAKTNRGRMCEGPEEIVMAGGGKEGSWGGSWDGRERKRQTAKEGQEV